MRATPSCPDCDGSGTVEVDRADRRGEHYTETAECGSCGGAGEAEDDFDAVENDRPPVEREVDWEQRA